MAEMESYLDAVLAYVHLKRANNICTVKCKVMQVEFNVIFYRGVY